jgi:hypothetical protein
LLRLIGPDGTPIRAANDGDLPPTLLLESGFYSVVVSGDGNLNYDLTIRREQPVTNWRWTLERGEEARASLNADASLHEYRLSDLDEGDYQIVVRPTSAQWQARAFLLDASDAVIAIGEVQSDGSTLVEVRLGENQDYRLQIAADGTGGTYDVLFDVANNFGTPAPLEPGVVMLGRLNELDSADEWLWQTDMEDLINIRAARTEGDLDLSVRIYAPGNLFLQEYDANANGEVIADSVLLPVGGTYIIQVTRNGASGVYEIEVGRAGE